jgi:hypothetical protein
MNDTELFLKLLGGDKHTFQTINERKANPEHFKFLSKQHYAAYTDIKDKLDKWNNWGIGIFITINKTDGTGRRVENIIKVRALFADLDGSPLDPILEAKLEPHMIIESSKGRYHAYWLVDDCPLDKFSMYQKAIAKKFNSDPKVCDLPRVMRLPGFNHCKGEPYPVKVKWHNSRSPYFLKDIEEGLGLELEQNEKSTVKSSSSTSKRTNKTITSDNNSNKRFVDGRRNNDLFKVACALIGRGEPYENIKLELLSLNQRCEPPLTRGEVLEILDNAWNRYKQNTN